MLEQRPMFYAVAPCGLVYGPPADFDRAQACVIRHRLSPEEQGWRIVTEDRLSETLAEIDAGCAISRSHGDLRRRGALMNHATDKKLELALTEARNINEAANEELGYLKAVMAAITLMAEQDSHGNKGEIVALAKCAHWIAENLESNVDYFCDRMSGEVH